MALRAAFLAFLFALTVCAAYAESPDYPLSAQLRSEHFIVHYDPADPFLARLAAETAEEELARIAAALGYSTDSDTPFPLYVYRSHRDFIRAGGLAKRKYTVGTARASDQSIAVDASGAFVVLREVLAHEITHAVVFRLLGPRAAVLPLWFNEGLAKYFSESAQGPDDALIAQAAASGTLMRLSVLERDFPEKLEPLSYAASASAVRFLVESAGPDAPRAVLAGLTDGLSFDQAMHEATGLTGTQFADRWYARVSERFRLLRIIRVTGAAVGVLMAVLAAAAFAARRKRMREAAQQWEAEELEEAIRRQAGNDWARQQ